MRGKGNYKLTPEITNSKEEFKSELMELGITQENGEITPEMIYLKEEFKSELTELGQRQENYELVPEITHFNEEFKSELIEPGQTQPSAEVKEEELTACQLVSCVKEENINWYHNGEHVTLPAPDTGGARAMVETLGLHRGGQLSSSELETLTSIQAEHKGYATTVGEEGSLQDEDLGAGEDSLSPEGTVESVVKMSSRRHGRGETSSPEAILPDIMDETTQEMDICDIAMSPPSPEQDLTFKLSSSPSHHQQSYPYNRLNSQTTSSVPTRVSMCGGQKTSGFSSNVAVSSVPQFQSLETTGGNIVQLQPSEISKQGVATSSSNMAVSSVPHFQSLETTGGNIVQHRPLGISKQGVATNSSNFTPGPCQGIKPLLATIKHPATSGSGQMRNVYTITGNQHNQQSTPLMLATSLSGNTSITGKPTKIISSGQRTILASQTKVITLAQAQKLGLISPTKLQQIMSASSNKQSIPVNKLVSSESTITMMPASTMVKSSTNILPVPVSGIAQSKPATVSVATVHGGTAAVTTVNTDVKPLASSQKVVISQGPGTLQGMKPLLATMKRLATSGSDQMRNAYTKVIITDNRHNQQGKPVILAKSQSGDTSTTDKPIKIISSTSGQGTLLASPMNAITLPQAQQLGLISPTNLQQIMPTSQNKQSVTVNKPVSSSSKNAIMRSSTMVKSLRKILPAPVSSIRQSKPSEVSVSTVSGGTTVNTARKALASLHKVTHQGPLKTATVSGGTTVNTNGKALAIPKKFIIRKVPLKPGIRRRSGQRLKIPATRNAAGSNPITVSTVTTVAQPRTTTVDPVPSISGSVRPVGLSSVRVPPRTVKVMPIAPVTPAVRTVAPVLSAGQPGQEIFMPASQLPPGTNVKSLPATALSQLTSLPSDASSYVMIPVGYVRKVRNLQHPQSWQPQQPLPHLQQPCPETPEYWKYSMSYK